MLSGRRARYGGGVPVPRGLGGAAPVDPSYADARRRVLRAALAAVAAAGVRGAAAAAGRRLGARRVGYKHAP
ncbi:hypothetical protein [Streptomyces sp. NPDC006510]|uniref:hypothetical protein n=1 Tax=Streptomyces sp. NPDC006510 TaxID=3155600 RepID=UPI0033BA7201